MAWFITGDPAEYLAAAGDFLMSRLAENTVLITVAETLRERGPTTFGDADPLFGWWRAAGGPVESAFLHTPPNPLLVTTLPGQAVTPLVESWPHGRPLAGVNADAQVAAAFASAWRQRMAEGSHPDRRERLYRLGELVAPQPAPAGSPRTAAAADRNLLVAWVTAFKEETRGVRQIQGVAHTEARSVEDRLSYGGLVLWEVDGAPVSMAGSTRPVGGMIRIGPVYTPPGFRRRGYAGAVTAAVSQAALDSGTREVLLFTDLANATSNGVYQRLGFEPLGDRVVLLFTPADST